MYYASEDDLAEYHEDAICRSRYGMTKDEMDALNDPDEDDEDDEDGEDGDD